MPSTMPSTATEEHADEGRSSLQADVASFVASLGFSASSAGDLGSGFNDADFRKIGRINSKKKHQHNDIEASVTQKPEESQKKPSTKRKQKLNDYYRVSSGGAKKAKTAIIRSSVGNQTITEDGSMPTKGDAARPVSINDSSKLYSKLSSLLESGPWYEGRTALLSTSMSNESKDKQSFHDLSSKLVGEARSRGESLMQVVSAEFEKSRGKDSDMRWLMMARKTGTTADKVAAFTVLLQDNPVSNLKALDALLGMVTTKGGKRHAVLGIDALKELFMISLLPDRKLKYLAQQPLQAQLAREEDERLLLWYWEDCLKHRYEQFVSSLEEATKDKLPFLKDKAVKTIYELLKSKPEQERRLLSALVNKLGDPERKVASNAGYYLSCLLTSHPNMKMVVTEEVDSFLFRPHLGLRSKYQAVVFLNQTVLSNKGDGPNLAKRLIDIYFSLFKVVTAGDFQSGTSKDHKASRKWKDTNSKSHTKLKMDSEGVVEIDSRLLSALLTGVNRAFPFVAAEDIDILIQKHTPVLFRLVHSKNFNVGIQSLTLLYQLLTKSHAVSDRLYRALYAVLLSPGLTKSSKLEMFLGLVFKVIKSDINSKRMAAFAKRLMQVASQGSPQFTCGILLLLSEILKTRPTLWNAVTQSEDADDETEQFHDIKEDLISTIEDTADPTNNGGVCDGEVNIAPGKEPCNGVDSSSESDDLKCTVSDLEDDSGSSTGEEREITNVAIKDGEREINAGERETKAEDAFLGSVTKWTGNCGYNPRIREPSFCNADRACWWELTALASHVHPSVAAMAKTLLSGASILYKGNPLKDLTTNVFLDRFAEKKPKARRKSGNWHGSSLSAPKQKTSTSSMLPIGMEFLQLSEQEVAPEDVVFHKFYTNRKFKKGKVSKEAKIKDDFTVVDGVDGDDFLNDGSDDDDEEIDELLEHDEGVEMGSDESSDEDDDSDLGWIHLQTNGSQEKTKVIQIAEKDAKNNNGLGKKSRKAAHELMVEGKRKKSSKTESTLLPESSKISPFASLDDYSHLLDDQSLDKHRKHKPSSSRRKRGQHTR